MIGRTSTRILLPCLAGGLALLALAAGCSSTSSTSSASGSSSGKPSYCAGGQQLKTSVQDLGKANVASGGISSVQAALKNVEASTTKFDSEAKGAFPAQTTALRNALTGLQSSLKTLAGQPSTTNVKAAATQGAKLKTAAASLQSAWSAKCK
jgi:hypothetical protein